MSNRKADDYKDDELLSFNNKRKRMNLSLLQKREIIQYSDDYQTLSQEPFGQMWTTAQSNLVYLKWLKDILTKDYHP